MGQDHFCLRVSLSQEVVIRRHTGWIDNWDSFETRKRLIERACYKFVFLGSDRLFVGFIPDWSSTGRRILGKGLYLPDHSFPTLNLL
jgi:hypothetical protein